MKNVVLGGLAFVLWLGPAAWLLAAHPVTAKEQAAPRITVTMTPANGAEDVDPNLKAIVVTFDRPMRDKSWSVVTLGSRDQFPKGAGPVGYDAVRQVFTMPVELQPGKEYVFGLNAERFLGFRSEEGIPLAPLEVRFKTKQADK